MIVPMKKLYLLCVEKDREVTLDRLAKLGVVHISSQVEKETSEISLARSSLQDAQLALSALSAAADKKSERGSLILESASAEDGDKIVSKVLDIQARVRKRHE